MRPTLVIPALLVFTVPAGNQVKTAIRGRHRGHDRAASAAAW
jgi:hypothetical protein